MLTLRKVLGRLALAALALAAALLVAEIGFRALLRARHRARLADWSHPLFAAAPGDPLVHRLRPGAQGTARVEGHDVEWSYSIGSWGLRGPEPRAREEVALRVLALGDSYTFGWAVDDHAPWPRVLEQLLAARRDARDVEVLNAGVSGYNTEQEAAWLAELLPLARPDVVVLGFVMNDAEPPRAGPLPPDLLYRFAPVWLLEDLRLAVRDHLGWETTALPDRLWRQQPYLAQIAHDAPERAVCRDALGSMTRSCREAGVPLLVAVLPDFTRPLDERYPYRPIHATVLAWCAELGVPALDLLPAFVDADPGGLAVPGDGHPSTFAHRMLATGIADALQPLLAGARRDGARSAGTAR